MIKNKYFKKLISLAAFFSAHFRIIVSACFIIFLFYTAMLGIEINSAVDHVPSAEEINKKIQSAGIRKDLIKKIDNFIALRQEENVSLPDKNPFLPYQKEMNISPSPQPAATPEISLPKMAL